MIHSLSDKILNTTNATVSINEPMKKHTTYGIGGPAELFVLPSNKEAVSYTHLRAHET